MIWGAGAACAGLLLRHPVFLAILGLAAALAGRGHRAPRGWIGARWTAGLILFPAVLNFLLSRSGSSVVLELPWGWIGGPYTLEAFLFGRTAGVQLAALLAVMTTVQAAVEPTDVVRRIPAGLYPVAVSAAIGMSFPARAERATRAVRDAQLVRGHRPRGWRDFPAWATPLLVLSLENAQDLAEAMAVRGWPAGGSRRGGLTALGWFGWAAALLVIAFQPRAMPIAFGLAGMGTWAFAAAWRGPFRVERFRPEVWSRHDSLIAGLSLGCAVVIGALAVLTPGILNYSPYPTASWPTVHWQVGLALALLATPGWILGQS
jgi:energy-coupling factor transporter transmembrane protein EcfT